MCMNKGILTINDLDANNHFLSFENLQNKFRIRCAFLDHAGIITFIPKKWKNIFVGRDQASATESPATPLTILTVESQ